MTGRLPQSGRTSVGKGTALRITSAGHARERERHVPDCLEAAICNDLEQVPQDNMQAELGFFDTLGWQ
jgi:hypothetical protein